MTLNFSSFNLFMNSFVSRVSCDCRRLSWENIGWRALGFDIAVLATANINEMIRISFLIFVILQRRMGPRITFPEYIFHQHLHSQNMPACLECMRSVCPFPSRWFPSKPPSMASLFHLSLDLRTLHDKPLAPLSA